MTDPASQPSPIEAWLRLSVMADVRVKLTPAGRAAYAVHMRRASRAQGMPDGEGFPETPPQGFIDPEGYMHCGLQFLLAVFGEVLAATREDLFEGGHIDVLASEVNPAPPGPAMLLSFL